MSSTASLTVQEPPFPVPFVDTSTGLINPIWQLWLINFFNSQNGQNGAFAPVASPALTGKPTAPTAAPLTNNTQIATTQYADKAVAVETGRATAAEGSLGATIIAKVAVETARAEAAEALLAPQASPTFTGVLTAPVAELTGPTPTGAGTALGLGNTTGFGNGASGAVTVLAQGTGTGPATPGTVVNFLEIDLGGVKWWAPLCQ